jgi:GT2 family glycosyltransferase
MNISIGICTRDNQEGLNLCLNSLFSQRIKGVSVELIVIDQSADTILTKTVLSKHQNKAVKKHFKLVYKEDFKKGIAFARNRLFKTATGAILFTIDDDVTVKNGWLQTGVRFFKQNPKAGVAGGKVVLFNKIPTKSRHLLKQMNFNSNFWPYALYDLGKNTMRLDPKIINYPEFANMAIRKNVYKKVSINTQFGNQSAMFKVFGGEDPDFLEKAKKIGGIYYLPVMTAYHHIKPSKFEKSFFRLRYWEFGKERALLEKIYSKERTVSLKYFMSCLRASVLKEDSFFEQVQVIFMTSYFLSFMYFFFTKQK